MTGNAARIKAPRIAVQSLLYWPKSVLVERRSVYFLLSETMISGNKKSFHTHRTFVIIIVAVIGFNIGNTILKNICIRLPPSMAAASSISMGIPFTKPWYRKMAILTPSPAYIKERPIKEFLMLSTRETLYNGIIMELNGINIEKINNLNRNRESFVFVRQSLHPAKEENKTIKNMLNDASIAVLVKLRP